VYGTVVKCEDGKYKCSWWWTGGLTDTYKCEDDGCKKSASSGGSASGVVLSPSQLGALVKMNIKTAYVGSRNADGTLAKLGSWLPFVGKQVQHVTVWLGDGQNGFGVEYGDYENTRFNHKNNFFGKSGARVVWLSLNEFKAAYDVTEVKVGKEQTVKELWVDINQRSEWDVEHYNSVSHNCQHFAVSVLKALKVTGQEQATLPPAVNAALRK
jgi:hypothetical protein